MTRAGPGYGHNPNATKTVLVTKLEHGEEAGRLFADTGVVVRVDGSKYLGGALGDEKFRRALVAAMTEKWCWQLHNLAETAQTQPQAAYTVFIQGWSSRWKYHIRSTECSPDAIRMIDKIINTEFLPAMTGREFTADQPERRLHALPARLGGMAIPVMGPTVTKEHSASLHITQPIVDLVINPVTAKNRNSRK